MTICDAIESKFPVQIKLVGRQEPIGPALESTCLGALSIGIPVDQKLAKLGIKYVKRPHLFDDEEHHLTVSEPTKLRDAPAHFLKGHWLRLMELKGSEACAIGALTHSDPGLMVFYRRQLIEEGRASADMLDGESAYQLVEQMIESFRKLGSSGKIIGKGIYTGTGSRQIIPSELWADLEFDFEANSAKSQGLSYSHITLEQAVPAGNQGDVVSRIVAWLTQRRLEEGEALKKTLAADTRAEFGGECTESIFNEAYKKVYQRQRGRPRASET